MFQALGRHPRVVAPSPDRRTVLGFPALRCLVGLWLVGSSARAEVVSLAELEARALQSHPDIAQSTARTHETEAEMEKVQRARYPRFNATASVTTAPGGQLLTISGNGGDYYVQGSAALNGDPPSGAYLPALRAGVDVSGAASLYDFGRTAAAIEAGREGHAAALASREATREQLLSGVRSAYLAWLTARELLRLSQANVDDARARRERIERMIAEGQKPKAELTPAKADELLAGIELARSQRDAKAAQLALEHIVGEALVDAAEPDLRLLAEDARLPGADEARASARRALQRRYAAEKAGAEALSRQSRPDLGINATAGIRASQQNVITFPSGTNAGTDGADANRQTKVFPLYGAGVALSIPLWDGGLSRANADAARAKAEQVKAELDGLERAQDHEQKRARAEADSALERLAATVELEQVCRQRLQDAEEGYELGVSSIDAIGQARGLLRRAQTEALLARVDYASAKLRLAAPHADR